MKPPTPETIPLTFNFDIATPAKALKAARAAYAHATGERDRLIAKRAELKQEEADALRAASLEDPETFRAVADLRMALEIVERKLTELEQFITKAGNDLSNEIRKFMRSVQAPLAAAKADLGQQQQQITSLALRPYQPQLNWIRAGHAQLEELSDLFADYDYTPDNERERLRNSEALLEGAATAAAPLPPPVS